MNMLQMMTQSGAAGATYVDDVFSAYTYTGNGSTQTITNGIDLSTKGGMVWLKPRSGTYGSGFNHKLFDTARSASNALSSNTTDAEVVGSGVTLTSFDTTGFTIPNNDYNASGEPANCNMSWSFREAPKFFDIVTYTGNGANRTIAHSLGQAPGMIIIKRTDSAAGWFVYHRSLANTAYLRLDLINAKTTGATTFWNSTTADASTFSLGTNGDVNQSGGTFVAYLFSHDASTDGLIQCVKATTNGSGAVTVTLGWEPQFVMMKSDDTNQYWQMFDAARGLRASATSPQLFAGTSGAEVTNPVMAVDSTGFTITQYASTDYYCVAIRRSNKPPTVGTQVYSAIARTGTGANATVTGVGFAPDLVVPDMRSGGSSYAAWFDRLRGSTQYLISSLTADESNDTNAVKSFSMDGMSLGDDSTSGGLVNASGSPYINWFFKRAVGVFDVVCYTGTGSATTITHGLGVAPELMIVKQRSVATAWAVYASGLANTEYLVLNTTASKSTGTTYWNSTTPTSSVFSLGTAGDVNTSSATYVAYLFATKAGISKVGSYTGNGSSQTINCGFTTGARFILIKRTDSTGDWYVWDSTRGIVAGNDPHLSLNTTAAEVTTDDSIDADTGGFIANQLSATNINVNTATYIFLAFA